MATPETYERLRMLTGETDSDRFTDVDLDQFLTDAQNDLNAAAAAVWRAKMNEYADLVDTSEAGSSRADSILYTRAKEMAAYYGGLAGGAPAPGSYSTTRPITR